MVDAFGQEDTYEIVKSLSPGDWIAAPMDAANPLQDSSALINSYSLVSNPHLVRTALNRGADALIFYRMIDTPIDGRDAFISNDNLALYVKPLITSIVELGHTEPLVNMSKVPDGFYVKAGQGVHEGRYALIHNETGEYVKNREVVFFPNVVQAISSIELPENSYFINPTGIDITAALDDVFTNPVDVIAYRGEHGAAVEGSPFHSRHYAISFSNEDVARQYALSPNNLLDLVEEPRLIQARISIKNPVMNDNEDPFIDFQHIASILGADRAKEIALSLQPQIEETNNFEELINEYAPSLSSLDELLEAHPVLLDKLYVDAHHVFDNDTWVLWFKDAGYDGLVHGGNGDSALQAEYKIFDESQAEILSVTSLEPVLDQENTGNQFNAESAQSLLESIAASIRDMATSVLDTTENSPERVAALRAVTPNLLTDLNQFASLLNQLQINGIKSSDALLPDLLDLGDPVISEVYNRINDTDVEIQIVSLSASLAAIEPVQPHQVQPEPADVDLALVEEALESLETSKNFADAGISTDRDGETWSIKFKGVVVAELDGALTRTSVQEAFLRKLGIAELSNEKLYANIKDIPEKLLQMQDVLDPIFTQRYYALRNQLLEMGYTDRTRASVFLSPSNESTIRTEFLHVGVGKNVAGITYHVGDKAYEDTLALSPDEIVKQLHSWVEVAEQEQTELLETAPAIVNVGDFKSVEELSKALDDGRKLLDGDTTHEVVQSTVGWMVVETTGAFAVTKGGDPRGKGYSKSEAIKQAVEALQYSLTQTLPEEVQADPETDLFEQQTASVENAPIEDMFGSAQPVLGKRVTLSHGTSNKHFHVLGDGLIAIDSQLERAGGRFLKKLAGYRFDKLSESSVRALLKRASDEGLVVVNDEIRKPFELRVDARVRKHNGHGGKVTEIKRNDKGELEVVILADTNTSFIIAYTHTSALGMEADYDVTITNWDELNKLYPIAQVDKALTAVPKLVPAPEPSIVDENPAASVEIGQNEIYPEFTVFRGNTVERIGKNTDNEYVYRSDDGIRYIKDSLGVVHSEAPFIEDSGELSAPANRDDRFKLLLEVEAENYIGGNVIPLRGNQPSTGEETAPTKIVSSEELDTLYANTGINAALLSDYLKSFAKLEDHQQNNFDDGGGGYDFTTRRLKMDLDRKFINLSNLAASNGYEIPLHVLNELAESAYKKTELLASRLANVIFKNEISTAIDSKKVVTLKDALELGESYAHGLPAYWVNEKIKSFKNRDDHSTFAVFVSKVYGSKEEQERAISLVEGGDNESIRAYSEELEAKYARSRALVELPAVIQNLTAIHKAFRGNNPIARDNTARAINKHRKEYAAIQYDIDAIQITSDDEDIYSNSGSLTEIAEIYALKHGLSYDAGLLYSQRVNDFRTAKMLVAFANEPETKLIQEAARVIQSKLPDGVKVVTGETPESAHIYFRYGTGSITIGRPRITDENKYDVGFYYRATDFHGNEFNRTSAFNYQTLPTPEQLAEDGLSFTQVSFSNIKSFNSPTYGEKYASLPSDIKHNLKEIAKMIREDIKAAIENGSLPKGLKVGVRKDYKTIDLTITKIPDGFKVVNPAYALFTSTAKSYDSPPRDIPRYTHEYYVLRQSLKNYLDAYNYDNSDRQTDYHNYNYSSDVDIDNELISASQNAALLEATLPEAEQSIYRNLNRDSLYEVIDFQKRGFTYIGNRRVGLEFGNAEFQRIKETYQTAPDYIIDNNGLSVVESTTAGELLRLAHAAIKEASNLENIPFFKDQITPVSDQDNEPGLESEVVDMAVDDNSADEDSLQAQISFSDNAPDPQVSIITDVKGNNFAPTLKKAVSLMTSLNAIVTPFPSPVSRNFNRMYVPPATNGMHEVLLTAEVVSGDSRAVYIHASNQPSQDAAMLAVAKAYESYAKQAFDDTVPLSMADSLIILNSFENNIGRTVFTSSLLTLSERNIAKKGIDEIFNYYEGLSDRNIDFMAPSLIITQSVVLPPIDGFMSGGEYTLGQLDNSNYVWGSVVSLGNGNKAEHKISVDSTQYESASDAAVAFVKTVAALNPDMAGTINDSLYSTFREVIPVNAMNEDNPIPDLTKSEAYTILASRSKMDRELQEKLANATTDEERAEIQTHIAEFEQELTESLVVHCLEQIKSKTSAVLNFSNEYIESLAADYPELRREWNQYHLDMSALAVDADSEMVQLWLQDAGLASTHVIKDGDLVTTHPFPLIDKFVVSESIHGTSLESSYSLDMDSIPTEQREVFANQARLFGAINDGDTLLFSNKDNLNQFSHSINTPYSVIQLIENEQSSINGEQRNGNISSALKLELENAGYIQTVHDNIWLTATENNVSVQVAFHPGIGNQSVDVMVSRADAGTTKEVVVTLDNDVQIEALEASINEILDRAGLEPLRKPSFNPSLNDISGDEVCKVLLGAGLNVEETAAKTWIVTGTMIRFLSRFRQLGGTPTYQRTNKAFWEFNEPIAKKLAVVIANQIEKANPETEVNGFYVTVSYNDKEHQFETCVNKGNPDEKIIIGAHSSLSSARVSILSVIADDKKLNQLWNKVYPNSPKIDESNNVEETANEQRNVNPDQAREPATRQDASSSPVRGASLAEGTRPSVRDEMASQSGRPDQRVNGPADRESREPASKSAANDVGRSSENPTNGDERATLDDGEFSRITEPSEFFDLNAVEKVSNPSAVQIGQFTHEALETLLSLRTANRDATPEEKITLSRMVGLGASNFNERKTSVFEGWERNHVNDDIRRVINKFTSKEAASLKGTVLTAFYTPSNITNFMWASLEKMGINSIKRKLDVVDPGVGTGNFIGSAPLHIRQNANFHGVECDAITAEIASHLYPEVRIINKEFQNVQYTANSKDIFIGNPPYSDVRTFNPNTGKREVLHDLFLRESIKATRPGGIVSFVTSSGTLDKKSSSLREYVSTQADLLAAFRLPNTAFKADAGTEVMTDILFFRKRKPQEQALNTDWVKTIEFDGGDEGKVLLNKYYEINPSHVLGTLHITSGQYGPVLACKNNGQELENLLQNAINKIPENQFNPDLKLVLSEQSAEDKYVWLGETLSNGRKVGELVLSDSDEVQIIRYNGSSANYFTEPAPVKSSLLPMLKAYIGLRDCARSLIDLESRPETTEINEQMKTQRQGLNALYDEFAKTFGPISRKATSRILRQDPGYFFTAQLEHYDKESDIAVKADIFNRRVVKAEVLPTITDPMDAIYYSMSNYGNIEPRKVEDLLARDWASVRAELGNKIFLDPKSGKYFTESIYLSGDVIDKLETAERTLATNPEMSANIEALKAVIPKQISITDIRIKIGATWIPEEILTRFVREVLNATGYSKADKCYVNYNHTLNTWNFKVTDLVLREAAARNNIEFGTEDFPFHKLFKNCLEQTRPTVYEFDKHGNRIANPAKTQAARDKQALVEEKFIAMILNDADLAIKAQNAYNYRMNRFVPNNPDGQYVTFPGLTTELKGKPFAHGKHQLGVIERALTSEYGLLVAHEAGGGKTISTVTIGMKFKQLRLANKPLIAVPNHMLVQYTIEALDLYPNAKILTVSHDDLSKTGREQFAFKCLMNDWDLVICTHEQFQKMKMPSWYIQNAIENEIGLLEEMILNNKEDRATVKQLERQKKALGEKLSAEIRDIEKRQDDIDFTTLGFDWVGYDEGHYLKNRAFASKNSNLAGVQTLTSQRARDAEMKFDWIRESRGDTKGVLLATGTPISNTIGEVMVILRYLAPELLERAGIYNFDDFIANYGETKIHVELTADGSGYQLKERLSGFHNIPELMKLFIQVADIKMGDQLDLKRPDEKRITRVSEMSPEQRLFMDWLSYRAKDVKTGKVMPHEDNMLSIYTDLQTISIDPRLYHHKLCDAPNSKINMEIESIYDSWVAGNETLDTQLIFLDRYQKTEKVLDGKTKSGDPKFKSLVTFNLIEDIKNKLIAKGIPANQIGSIHDVNTDEEKEELFSSIRKGSVRICFATTAKMGVGTNVQTRGKDLRHLSYPMRAIDIEQRNKRFVRQGNMHSEVNLHYPTTKDSGDLALLQMIERKDKMTKQILSCDFDNMARSLDEDFSPSYEDIMAVTTGNTLIKDKLETDSLVDKYRRQRKAHENECYSARLHANTIVKSDIPRVTSYIAESGVLASSITQDALETFSMKIQGVTYTKASLAGAAIHTLAKRLHGTEKKMHIGEYLGHKLSLVRNPIGVNQVALDVKGIELRAEITESLSYFPSRIGTVIKQRINGIEEGAQRLEQMELQAKEFERISTAPFPYADELAAAEEKQSKINIELAKSEMESKKDVIVGTHPFAALLAKLKGENTESKEESQNRLLSAEEIMRVLESETGNSEEIEKVKELTLTR
ncbi:SNF2-related protein [Cellvibrio sp. QJXJ]|uniref:SNF2-related protein n=1 Tax=Cellvibrio sp. QJXJ TaxID=2964606 RepID=UPI0021C2AAB5|nr:SNF2-related protein [Cellvibrio sp. QJXJ]UUA75114.1 SNF2-related protein [Cellvibrio sp. QJXJ]